MQDVLTFKVQLCKACYECLRAAKRRGSSSHTFTSVPDEELDSDRYYTEELVKFLPKQVEHYSRVWAVGFLNFSEGAPATLRKIKENADVF